MLYMHTTRIPYIMYVVHTHTYACMYVLVTWALLTIYTNLPGGQLDSVGLKDLQSFQPRAHNLLELLEGVRLEGQSRQPLRVEVGTHLSSDRSHSTLTNTSHVWLVKTYVRRACSLMCAQTLYMWETNTHTLCWFLCTVNLICMWLFGVPMHLPLPHQSTGDSIHHDPLWEVHRVGHCQHNQPCIGSGGPVKEVVQNGLLPCPQQVQLQRGGVGWEGGGAEVKRGRGRWWVGRCGKEKEDLHTM